MVKIIKRISKKQPTRKEDLEYKEPLNTIPVYPDKESSSSEPKKVPIKRVKSKLPTRKEDLNYMDVLNVEPKYSDKSSHSSKPIKKVKSKSTVKDEDLKSRYDERRYSRYDKQYSELEKENK